MIALHAAVGFLVVSIGVLALRPEVGVVRLLLAKTAGGLLLRRLTPVVILGPTLLSWGCHTGEEMSEWWYRATGTKMIGALGKTQFMMEELPILTSPGGKWVTAPEKLNTKTN